MVHERGKKPGGFTVVELIVALTISAVTLLSGYELFEALKGAGDVQSADLAAAAQILHGLDQMRDDLWHAVPRVDTHAPIFVGANAGLDKNETTARLLEFYALCPNRTDGSAGDLRHMHHIKYELSRIGDSVCLYRSASPVVGPGPISDQAGREQVLEDVEQITVAFRRGSTWEPRFSSEEELPACVGVTVTARGQTWPFVVTLPCGMAEGQP
jgi:type II secretion system protein J